jgi:hypothetical protein
MRSKVQLVSMIEAPAKDQRDANLRTRSRHLTDCIQVASWLNGTRGKKESRIILWLRDELIALKKSMLHLSHKPTVDLKSLKTLAELTSIEEYEAFRKRHNKVNLALRRYALSPVMAYDPSDLSVWRSNATSRDRRGPHVSVIIGEVAVEIGPANVAMCLVRLASDGELDKVRKCKWCHENWIVAERQRDRFCSKKCRDADYQSRPGFAEQRRVIQRNFRKNQKRLAAQALERAKSSNSMLESSRETPQ